MLCEERFPLDCHLQVYDSHSDVCAWIRELDFGGNFCTERMTTASPAADKIPNTNPLSPAADKIPSTNPLSLAADKIPTTNTASHEQELDTFSSRYRGLGTE